MPSYVTPRVRPSAHDRKSDESCVERDQEQHVFVTSLTEENIAEIHNVVTKSSLHQGPDSHTPHLDDLKEYVKQDEPSGPQSVPLSVCFKNVSTFGSSAGSTTVKTLKDAIWRTLTLQDIYEWTLKRVLAPDREKGGRALIHDFSGVVRNGQMMLVLGCPGSGCSTFLRTVANDHSSFRSVKGSLDYSGLSSQDISKRFRGSVVYVPEDDVHLPGLTVRQTLEFALQNNTAKKWRHEIPRFLDVFATAFGMSHVMDTVVGNEYVRGVSGGERKRVSILEALSSNSSVVAWDGSTRGLDASSALDYIRSLRIMTDACERATIVSIYQASDDIYRLVDKVMLISQGRMLYQGPANHAESYFNSLGYHRLPRQTMSDFLTSISSGNIDGIPGALDASVPKGAADLESAFRKSQAFQNVLEEIRQYESELGKSAPRKDESSGGSACTDSTLTAFHNRVEQRKSRFVPSGSSYSVSFFRQAVLCTKREMWHLRNHLTTFNSRLLCTLVCAFLLGSMFYNMPNDTSGVYSRGGFIFYSAVLVAWFQLSELETAFTDRDIVSRQRRFAVIRPSAVVLGKGCLDFICVVVLSTCYSLVAYFLSGMKREAGAFFTFVAAGALCGVIFTSFYRVFAAASPRLEIALRYCGLVLLSVMVCGGYFRPVHLLISEVPWLGWLAYVTPVIYTYEIMMAMEFHGRDFTCAAGSVIPSGPGYRDPSYQSCAYRGVASGELTLNGDRYIEEEFGFRFSHIGRNFGILFLFLFGLLLINMWLVEAIDWSAGSHGAVEYTKGRKKSRRNYAKDEETTPEVAAVDEVVQDSSPSMSSEKRMSPSSTFSWRDLNYSVPHIREQKQLLRGISGFCESGRLTALVGPSGAGKSTLLTVLTNQATGTLTGDIKINGENIPSSFGQEIGYCQQMDIHVETSTVQEAFEFSALLRQRSSASREQRQADVENVLHILGMTELRHAVIRSLSLEQKKRTTIGVELCAKPNLLLFLDEPTSGLDSQGAMNIIRLLRRLADSGLAIVCTIHQASQEQFELFDRVLALDHSGTTYYFGDIGEKGCHVLEYFSRHGVVAEADKNVADLLIEVISRSSSNASQDWAGIWARSLEAEAVLDKIDDVTSKRTQADHDLSAQSQHYASSTLQQTLLLTKRTFQQYWRTPDYIYSRLYCSFFHSLFNGLVFLQLGNSVADLQYRIFACFLVIMIVPEFISACSMMFVENRNIWTAREYPSRIYGWFAFASSQVIAEIPWALAGGVIFYVIFYFLIGLPLGTPAGYSFLMMMMFHMFSTSWGQWIAALSTDAAMAASIMPFFVVMCEFFNGVLQPRELMPAVWRYTMYYVGPFTYWISGLVAMILPTVAVHCEPFELTRFEPPPGTTCGDYAQEWLTGALGYLSNPNSTTDCGYCQYTNGQDYLSTVSVSTSDGWPYLGIFALFTVTNYLSVYLWVYIKSARNWLPW